MFRLLSRIVARGKFTASGPDFRQVRLGTLKEFSDFVPPGWRISPRAEMPARSPVIRYWAGQAAFLKACLRRKLAHLRLPSARLHYIRMPRAASTSVSYALLRAKYPRLREHVLSPSQINFLIDANLETHISPRHPDDIYFTAVRNPFSRLVSVYRAFFEHCDGDFIYADYLFGILRKEMSFATFVGVVSDIPDKLKDQHFRPQHDLLAAYTSGDVPVSVFKIEDAAALRNFLSPFGLSPRPLNHANDKYHYPAYYDMQTFQLASHVYRSDIRLFGYEQTRQELEALIRHKSQ